MYLEDQAYGVLQNWIDFPAAVGHETFQYQLGVLRKTAPPLGDAMFPIGYDPHEYPVGKLITEATAHIARDSGYIQKPSRLKTRLKQVDRGNRRSAFKYWPEQNPYVIQDAAPRSRYGPIGGDFWKDWRPAAASCQNRCARLVPERSARRLARQGRSFRSTVSGPFWAGSCIDARMFAHHGGQEGHRAPDHQQKLADPTCARNPDRRDALSTQPERVEEVFADDEPRSAS